MEQQVAIKVDRGTWYDVDETAALLGCSPKTLEVERRTGGGIPYSKIGKRIYYQGGDIEDHLTNRRRRSTADRPISREAA